MQLLLRYDVAKSRPVLMTIDGRPNDREVAEVRLARDGRCLVRDTAGALLIGDANDWPADEAPRVNRVAASIRSFFGCQADETTPEPEPGLKPVKRNILVLFEVGKGHSPWVVFGGGRTAFAAEVVMSRAGVAVRDTAGNDLFAANERAVADLRAQVADYFGKGQKPRADRQDLLRCLGEDLHD